MRPRAARDASARLINVTYLIDEGPRVYIERINIIGNSRTRDYVIRREFRLAEGDAYNPFMVDKAKKRLQQLGFFKTVEIKRRPGSAPDRVILDVELLEQSTGELSFGAGYSTSEGVIGDISVSERNLLGRGQFLRLRLAGSQERMQIDLSFTEPRFLDRNLAAGFDLFHKDVNLSSASAFRTKTTGGSLRVGFPITENLWLTNSYTLTVSSIYDVQAGSIARHQGGSRRRDHVLLGRQPGLRYAQPSKEPHERLLPRDQRRVCGPRRRCAVLAGGRRRALLLSGHRKDHLCRARAWGATSGPGAARTSA